MVKPERFYMANSLVPKKRGAPPGNQNARKHGFYSKVLDEDEKLDLEFATEVEGIEEEIALLRVKIKSVLRHDPDNVELITHATNALARLLITKYNLDKDDKKGLREAITNVLKDVALQLGIGISNILDKK